MRIALIFIFCTSLFGCRNKQLPTVNKPQTSKIKANNQNIPLLDYPTDNPKREFRAAWVATVANIDWPSNKNLSTQQQKEEFEELISYQQLLGLNAVLVQVRAASDAFYSRSTEPWSEWLTGAQGKAPEPYYDPMHFMIEQAHERNIEFHAWLNLNRGTHSISKSISPKHITREKPEWFLSFDKHKLYNFGIPEVRDYLVNLTRNMVRDYDVDGIHFDDYFYPYTVKGETLNDYATFRKYGQGFSNIEDWRRNNIDLLIEAISNAIREEKPWVKFGVSPFSVWRNASTDPLGSKTRAGQTSYDNLFADTKSWPSKGWVDYMAPQVYFTFENRLVPFKTITDWWTQHMAGRNLYIGHATYKVDPSSRETAWRDPMQIAKQINYGRNNDFVTGDIFYNSSSLKQNKLNLAESISQVYSSPALPPLMPWKGNTTPAGVKELQAKKVQNLGVVLQWNVESEDIHKFLIYRFEENEPYNVGDPTKILKIQPNIGIYSYVDETADLSKNYVYVLSTLDRLSNETLNKKTVKL